MAAALAAAALAGCATAPPRGLPTAAAPGERTAVLLAVNDVYQIDQLPDGSGGLARLRAQRVELEKRHPDLLVLHAGDLLFPSLLSRRYRGAHMVDVLNLLDGDPEAFDPRLLATFGNHEFDDADLEDAAELNRRIADSQFHWLGSNVTFRRGDDGQPLVASPNLAAWALVESGGIRIGLFSLTTDVKHPEYVEAFGDLEATARRLTAQLRREGAEVVVALTHLLMSQDRALLAALGADGPDLIVGGHDHERQAAQVGGRWVVKADADARTAAVIWLRLRGDGSLAVDHLHTFLGGPPPDLAVAERVGQWNQRFAREHCAALDLAPDCLEEVLGRTRTELQGEELRIRKYETSLGNWIADQMLAAFADRGAQVAFLNSGTLRLNLDLPAGADLTRLTVEQLFGYPAPLRLLRLDGRTLEAVAQHAVSNWSGSGHWLQVAGLAFAQDPAREQASRLTLLAPGGPRPLAPDEEVLAVTVGFLVDPRFGQDGYTMLTPEQVVAEGPDLKELVVEALEEAGEAGIAPVVEGRICNLEAPGPCLAVAR